MPQAQGSLDSVSSAADTVESQPPVTSTHGVLMRFSPKFRPFPYKSQSFRKPKFLLYLMDGIYLMFKNVTNFNYFLSVSLYQIPESQKMLRKKLIL